MEQMFAFGADQASKNARLCAKCFLGESRHLLRRCQEKEEAEETVKKNKVTPVSSWCYQCLAGFLKALQRVVWSLIFLVFGVCKATVDQAQKMREKDLYPIFPESTSDERGCFCGRRVTGNGMIEFFVKKKKKRETARVRTQEPSKEAVRRSTQEPSRGDAVKRKGGKFRKRRRERRRKKKEV